MANDDRALRWHFDGFGRDDRLCLEVELSREQIAQLRHLFDRGEDEWMEYGEYPVPPELWPALRPMIGAVELSPDVEYFIAASRTAPAPVTIPAQSPASDWSRDLDRSGA